MKNFALVISLFCTALVLAFSAAASVPTPPPPGISAVGANNGEDKITRDELQASSDSPVSADYTGSGMDNIGIFRGSSGMWDIRGLTRTYYGRAGDIPATR